MHPLERCDPSAYALPDAWAARLLSPALVVYLERVRANLDVMLAALDGDAARWRPHVKTSKIPEVFVEVARAGVRAFKCATTREASELLRALAGAGIEDADVLLAYPLIDPALCRLAQVAGQYPRARVSVLCEDAARVRSIPAGLALFADLNPGMDRTGIDPGSWGRVADIARAAGERFRGLHYYDGHRIEADPVQRRTRAHQGYDRLLDFCDQLRREGIALEEIVTAGTPALGAALDYAPFRTLQGTRHRVSPGTVVYHDVRSEELNPHLALRPAALVFSRVVSHPAQGVVTCDAGSKSLAAEAGDPCAFVLGWPGLEPMHPSEEHLPLRVKSGPTPPVGTPLYLVPHHVCPTVNLANDALLVDGSAVRVVPVTARGHELLLE